MEETSNRHDLSILSIVFADVVRVPFFGTCLTVHFFYFFFLLFVLCARRMLLEKNQTEGFIHMQSILTYSGLGAQSSYITYKELNAYTYIVHQSTRHQVKNRAEFRNVPTWMVLFVLMLACQAEFQRLNKTPYVNLYMRWYTNAGSCKQIVEECLRAAWCHNWWQLFR